MRVHGRERLKHQRGGENILGYEERKGSQKTTLIKYSSENLLSKGMVCLWQKLLGIMFLYQQLHVDLKL
jgi:hypothetical protein